jgi:hypothetical protein
MRSFSEWRGRARRGATLPRDDPEDIQDPIYQDLIYQDLLQIPEPREQR